MPSTSAKPATDFGKPRDYFATTHWTVVLQAGRSVTTRARQALAQLCQVYWHPLYAYMRRRGHSPHDAEDLTQGFFARLLGEKSEVPYTQLAKEAGLSEEALRVAVHRLRQRYRQMLRDEIAQMVATPAEVDEEIRHLFHALAG